MIDTSFDANIGQAAIFIGAFFGNFLATIIPWWNEYTKFKQYDIQIFFDHKFAAAALVSGITAVVTVSAAYNTVVTTVDGGTIFLAAAAAFGIGLGLNKGINIALPSPNQEQKAQLAEAQKVEIINDYEHEKAIQAALSKQPEQQQAQNNNVAINTQ